MSERVNNIGPTLKAYRQEQRLSLRDLAGKTGISAATLSRIERGSTVPTLSQLHEIAEAYGYDDVLVTFTNSTNGKSAEIAGGLSMIVMWAKAQLEVARELVDALEEIVATNGMIGTDEGEVE